MLASEICPLTKEAVRELLRSRQTEALREHQGCQRRASRWPFAGTVELWVPSPDGTEEYVLGTCLNLSETGLGVQCEETLPVGARLNLAVHQPEVTFHGRGIVRHCTKAQDGTYIAGMQFEFAE